MPDLFGLDIGGILRDAIGSAGGLRPVTLVKVYTGSRVPGDLAGGTNADTVSYTTEGILEAGSDRDFTGTGWAMTRRQRAIVTVLGAPLTEAGVAPDVGDRVTIEGATYEIKIVDRDPAAATYSLQGVGA